MALLLQPVLLLLLSLATTASAQTDWEHLLSAPTTVRQQLGEAAQRLADATETTGSAHAACEAAAVVSHPTLQHPQYHKEDPILASLHAAPFVGSVLNLVDAESQTLECLSKCDIFPGIITAEQQEAFPVLAAVSEACPDDFTGYGEPSHLSFCQAGCQAAIDDLYAACGGTCWTDDTATSVGGRVESIGCVAPSAPPMEDIALFQVSKDPFAMQGVVDAVQNLMGSDLKMKYEKDGLDEELTMVISDDGQYEESCPDDWVYAPCVEQSFRAEVAVTKDALADGVPAEDVTSTSEITLRSPFCAPHDCLDAAGDMSDHLTIFLHDVQSALNDDPGFRTKFEVLELSVDGGACDLGGVSVWVIVILLLLLSVGGGAFAYHYFVWSKKPKDGQGSPVASEEEGATSNDESVEAAKLLTTPA